MKKYIVSGLVALALVIGVSTSARAQTPTIAELQAVIAQLNAQLASVQAQLKALQGETNPSVARGITVNLTLGSRGDDVVRLQNFLISKGYLTIATGVAKGYFGPTTRAAVIRYQAANGISENNGYVGPITREKINAELNGSQTNNEPKITIVYPSGGETFAPGQQVTVKYVTSNFPKQPKVTVQLNKGAVYPNGPFNPVSMAVRPYIPATGSYTVTIPKEVETGTNYSFLVSSDYPTTETSGGNDAHTNNFAINGKSVPTTSFLNINRIKYNESTGVLDVTWKSTGISRDKVVVINLAQKDASSTYEVNLTQGYCEAQGGCIPVSEGKASFKLSEYKTISGKPLEGAYTLLLGCWDKNSEMTTCAATNSDSDTVEVSGVVSTSAGVESSITSETRVTNLSSTRTLRPGSYETVYGAVYRVSPEPVTIERLDVRLDNLTSNRPSTDYIDSIQLLDSNQKTIATVRSVDFDQDEINKSGLRFTGVKYRLEDNKSLYLRVNTKASFPEKAEFNLYIPENGIRFVDGTAVSETFGRGLIKFKVIFEPSIVVNKTGEIPLNSPLYQKVEIVLPNGTKQTFMEKFGDNPAPLLTSMDKITVAQGSTVTINGKNLVVGGENMVFIDTLKGAMYQVNAQALNNADGGQRITFTVDSTWAPGQYYVYVTNKNGTSNYRGLTIMSAQGANAYSGFMDALNYIQQQLVR